MHVLVNTSFHTFHFNFKCLNFTFAFKPNGEVYRPFCNTKLYFIHGIGDLNYFHNLFEALFEALYQHRLVTNNDVDVSSIAFGKNLLH